MGDLLHAVHAMALEDFHQRLVRSHHPLRGQEELPVNTIIASQIEVDERGIIASGIIGQQYLHAYHACVPQFLVSCLDVRVAVVVGEVSSSFDVR